MKTLYNTTYGEIELARELWELLGDTPVDDDGYLEQDFLHFPKGTDREDIWHWFEEAFDTMLAKLAYHSVENPETETKIVGLTTLERLNNLANALDAYEGVDKAIASDLRFIVHLEETNR